MSQVCLFVTDSSQELLEFEFEFEWGFYALSASEASFRVRTYDCITYSVG